MQNAVVVAPTRNRNKIEIQKICPPIPKSELQLNSKTSFLGISINSPYTLGNKFIAILDFLISRQFEVIPLFIADSIYRYTVMINTNSTEEEGRIIGDEHVQQQIAFYQSLRNSDGKPYALKFMYASDIEKTDQFKLIYDELWHLFNTYTEFQNSVLNFSNYYFMRATQNAEDSAQDPLIPQRYLIEELALFGVLNQQGFNTLIYPGVIQTIYDVISMEHPFLKDIFKGYSFVSLRIKRRQ